MSIEMINRVLDRTQQGPKAIVRGSQVGHGGDSKGVTHQFHFYANPTWLEAETYDEAIKGIITLYQQSASSLFDLRFVLSYVSIYIISHLCMSQNFFIPDLCIDSSGRFLGGRSGMSVVCGNSSEF